MSIDSNPYLFIYLLGCFSVFSLMLFKIILFTTIDWFIKANILNKNLKKIMPPDNKTMVNKIVDFLVMPIVEILLSWINVPIMIWQIISRVFIVIRELFNSVPEEIKALRYPLRNNPYLDRESVWAYMIALEVKSGKKQPNKYDLEEGLDELTEYYPTFDRVGAMNKLKSLNVLSGDIVTLS